jgi:hypothetical protein
MQHVQQSFQMELAKKFQKVTSSSTVNTSSLDVNRKYPINRAERIVTKFGPNILMSIADEPDRTGKVFMPKRYGSEFSDVDIEDIDTAKCLYFSFTKERVIGLNFSS